MPTGFALTLPRKPPEPRQPKLLRCPTNYHDASDSAQLESAFRHVPITRQLHLVISASSRVQHSG